MKKALFAATALLVISACSKEGSGSEGAGNGATPVAAPAPAAGKAGNPARTTILEALGQSAEHKTLANAVNAAGLTETMSGSQPYTVFAPSEAAFQKLAAGELNTLLAPDSKGRLLALLTGHVVPGVVMAEDLGRAIDKGKGKAQLATVGGSTLSFSRERDAIVVTDAGGGQARVTRADMLQSNGVVHSVDGLLKAR